MENLSLAQFVQQNREKLGLSTSGLAKKCHIDLKMLESIESGQELFLPTTIRQNLAKGLKCSAAEIKELEKDIETKLTSDFTIQKLKEKILNGEENLLCPRCGSILITRIAQMYDLEDNLMLHPKARCSKCVFQIKD